MAEPAPVAMQAHLANTERPARVLVVEDDARMRRVLELLLAEHWGVETASDGRSALRLAREKPPDLILTDLLLPGMDGFALVRELRAAPETRTVPIIAISGLTEEKDRLLALEAGANDYLIKPFSERELILRVTTHLEMTSLRGQAAQRESEEQLESILDAALDAVVGMGAGGVVVYWNRRAETTFGWGREEAMGRRAPDLVLPPEVRERHAAAIGHLLENGEGEYSNRRLEVEGVRKDGSRFPMELTVTVAKAQGFHSFTAFCRDLSDRKRADAERNRRLEEAQGASRMKDEFLALLSHELRTPLSAIVGWAHMLRSGELDQATTARAIETIERNARVQNQLIEDILDVSRIVAGKFHLDMRSADLARVVEAAYDTVAPSAATKGVELSLQLDRTVGPAVGDPDRLQQVVWNLLSNAIKFTPKGGQVTVALTRTPAQEFELIVRDTGPGIDPAFLPHLFERFRQSGSGTRRQGGLGLGLSIVRHIVEMHGGTVGAESAGPGRGAVFTVRLPAVDNSEDSQRVPPLSHGDGGLETAPRLDGVRVLLVEDEPDARHLIAAVLQRKGARVFMSASAAEGLAILQQERPDVVLSDIALQDEDGYAFIRKVRALPAAGGGRTPAAALTGFGRLEDRMKALAAGFQLHAAKPVDPGELVAVVATLAGRP